VPTGAAGGRWAATQTTCRDESTKPAGDLTGGKRLKDEGKTDRAAGSAKDAVDEEADVGTACAVGHEAT
jgi:hypothetical protein